MMMPANYSAVAENEMVYVNGGWSGQIGPVKEISTLTSNIINIVGNTFLPSVINNTLGVMFGGTWGMRTLKNAGTVDGYNDDGDLIRNTMWNNWTNELEARATFGYEPDGNDRQTGFRGVVNAGMRVVGGLAAIAQLMNNDVKAYAAESDPIGISGLPV